MHRRHFSWGRSIGLASVALCSSVGVAVAGGSSIAEYASNRIGHALLQRVPYVQLATTSSIVVVWRTERKTTPVVRYGDAPDRLVLEVPAENIVTRVSPGTNATEIQALFDRDPEAAQLPKLHSAVPGTYQYEAKVTGLRPETTYFYGVFDGANRLVGADSEYRFTTHPPLGASRPLRVWVVGDSGTRRTNQSSVHHAMLAFTATNGRPMDMYLHLGDMAYGKGRDVEFQTRFFEVYESTLRHTVCWPTMGNHEGATSKGTNGVGPYYDAYVCPTRAEAGGLPSGTEAYYSFDYGRVHFICLDSHDLDRKPTGTMAQWLKMDMERTKADWIVAFFHHPPYTKGSHDSDREKQLIEMRKHIMPILESGGVDLVLSGHSHIYERSMLMDGAYDGETIAENVILDDGDGNPTGRGAYRKSAGIFPNEGDIQIVAGHGGMTLGRKGTMPVMRQTIVEFGSVILDFDGDTMLGRMLNNLGDVRDTFSMVKRGRVTPKRILNPWQPAPYKAPPRPPGAEPEEYTAIEPEDCIDVIPKHSEWYYLAGKHPETNAWMKAGFDAKGWRKAVPPFGFGYDGIRTELKDMRGHYSVVYLTREFEIEHADYVSEIGLMMNRYDDGFIAYLNGHEVARKNVGKGAGKDAKELRTGDDRGKPRYFRLKDFEKYLKDGVNVLAIEAHNVKVDNEDFIVDPFLIVED